MAVRVKLDDTIEGLVFQSDESSSFLNTKTGEMVLMTDYAMRAAEDDESLEDMDDWERDLSRYRQGNISRDRPVHLIALEVRHQ